METGDVRALLRDLAAVSRDGVEGFLACANSAGASELKTFLANRAQDCAACSVELQDMLRVYGDGHTDGVDSEGGVPEIAGAPLLRWREVGARIAGGDDKTILTECERGEDATLAVYRRALDSDLPPDVSKLIERQYQSVLQHHDHVKSLRDQQGGAPA